MDFYLDGRKAYLESIKDLDKYDTLLKKYETERSDLIYNFGKINNNRWKIINNWSVLINKMIN